MRAKAFPSIVSALLLGATSLAWSQCGPSGCYVHPAPANRSPSLPDAVRRATASTVRIIHQEASEASLGSGTLIATDDDASWILTCGHLFTEPGKTRIQIGGQASEGRVIAIDRRHDLALVRTSRLRGRPITVSAASQRGGELVACGFGGTGVLRAIRGVITGYATAQGASSPSLRIRGAVRSGDSGGPVFDLSGRLVAVIWGQRAGETYAMGGGPLRRILAKLPSRERTLKPVERRPAETPRDRDDAWKRQIERQIDRLGNRPAASIPEDLAPEDLARRDDLRDLSARWDRRFERLRGEVREGVADVPPTTTPSIATNVFAGLRRWGLSEALLAAGVGATPVAALMLGMRWWRTRRQRGASSQRRSDSQPVAIDTPPPPQQVVPETHYVSYERDEFARAHQWASEQLVRKFPGSVEMLTSLDSLIKQQLNGGES